MTRAGRVGRRRGGRGRDGVAGEEGEEEKGEEDSVEFNFGPVLERTCTLVLVRTGVSHLPSLFSG